ncbi:hypothetical protein DdX_18547 [Ditylenchus destructor]|uniref:Uncharacterized protein n=1 Tax=Ditylenchus destructor TaxID=166010 RepID=A0AAD4QY17_9BILA|nr:hypothetical protein DdX_18547 [Ditylenchus destructor]
MLGLRSLRSLRPRRENQYWTFASNSSANGPFNTSDFFRVNHYAKRKVILDHSKKTPDHAALVTILGEGHYLVHPENGTAQEVKVSNVARKVSKVNSCPVVNFSMECDGRKWQCEAVQLKDSVLTFASNSSANGPFNTSDFFRVNHYAKRKVILDHSKKTPDHAALVTILGEGHYLVHPANGTAREVKVSNVSRNVSKVNSCPVVSFSMESDGRKWQCEAVQLKDSVLVHSGNVTREWDIPADVASSALDDSLLSSAESGKKEARSPIPAIVHINSSKFRPQLIKMSGNNDDLDSTLVPSANERFIQTIPLKLFSDSNDDYCVYFITTLPGCGEYVLEQGASSDQNTVIHLDMEDVAADNLRTLVRTLLEMVECAIGKHGRQLPNFGQSNVTFALERLLSGQFSSSEERVEYYIDSVVNYDSPITDILSKVNNEQDASQLYDQYCDFIRRVASNSECIKCVVMTGRLLFQIKDFPDPDELGGSYTYLSFKKHKFNRYFAMTEDQFSEECQKLSVSDGIKKALMEAYSVKIDNDVYLRTAPTISFLKRFRKDENADVLESNHFIEHSFLVTLQSHFHDGDLYNLLSKVKERFEKGEPFLPFEKFSPINEFNPEVFLTFSNMLELRNLSKRGLNMPQESLHDFVRYLCHLSLLWPQKQDNAWSIGIPNVQSYSTLKYEREKALGLLSKIPKIRLLHLTELFKGTDDTSHLKELCTCFAQRVYEGSTSGSSAHSSGSSTPSGSTKSRPNKRKLGSTGDSASPSTMERYFSKEYARCDENSNFTRDYTRDFDSFQSDSYPDQVAGKFDNSTSDDMMEEDD